MNRTNMKQLLDSVCARLRQGARQLVSALADRGFGLPMQVSQLTARVEACQDAEPRCTGIATPGSDAYNVEHKPFFAVACGPDVYFGPDPYALGETGDGLEEIDKTQRHPIVGSVDVGGDEPRNGKDGPEHVIVDPEVGDVGEVAQGGAAQALTGGAKDVAERESALASTARTASLSSSCAAATRTMAPTPDHARAHTPPAALSYSCATAKRTMAAKPAHTRDHTPPAAGRAARAAFRQSRPRRRW